jgi:cation diffusion facilitator family transporter
MALAMLHVAARPADEDHAYGHNKAEYFSSGVEGSLILVAALSIAFVSVRRLLEPRPLEQVGLGVAVSVVASLVNLVVALVIRRAGRKHDSLALRADADHLLTDVWTSAGVVIGVGSVQLTGWKRIDPIVALLVAANILWTGVRIVRDSVLGLMDTALSPREQEVVRRVLDSHASVEVHFHAIRTRRSGTRRFVAFHVLVPGAWTIDRGHALLERIEADVRSAIPGATVFTHLESLNDPNSWEDIDLDRVEVERRGR